MHAQHTTTTTTTATTTTGCTLMLLLFSCFVDSWPLIGKMGVDGTPFVIKQLGFEKEQQSLLKTLETAKKAITIRMEVSTLQVTYDTHHTMLPLPLPCLHRYMSS